ncbi:hypothetical protein MMS46_28550, partial [Escherichia coli]|nr:hypothetical protein [Escherichia coli]
MAKTCDDTEKHAKIKVFFLFLFFIFLFSYHAKAANYCSLLWANNSLPRASLNASLDGDYIGIFPMSLQAGG